MADVDRLAFRSEIRKGTGSVRFVSVPDISTINQFDSVRKTNCPGSTRFGLCVSDASCLGPGRFGSFPRPVPAGSRMKQFGSIRPVWFGFLFLSANKNQLPKLWLLVAPPHLTGRSCEEAEAPRRRTWPAVKSHPQKAPCSDLACSA